MRRHHFLSLRDAERPPDSISLLIGAEADQRRRRSTQIPPSPAKEMHRRLHSVFGGVIPGEANPSASPNSAPSDASSDHTPDDEADTPSSAAGGFLGRVHSYSRLMHAHTKSQLARPTVGTLPSYNRTMHAFTLNQLNTHRRTSSTQTQSETSSPRMSVSGGTGVARLAVPAKLHAELENLVTDEVPPAPESKPEGGDVEHEVGNVGGTSAGGVGAVGKGESHVHGIDFRKLKRRSITDPELVRSAVSSDVRVRDFAAG